jgi:predicted O-methyltransferase YrrM
MRRAQESAMSVAVNLKDALKGSRHLNRVLTRFDIRLVPIRWVKKDDRSWLAAHFPGEIVRPARTTRSLEIEKRTRLTNALGPQPLWQGYASDNIGGSTRTPSKVRTIAAMGDLFTSLVLRLKPDVVVEFGTAFGVSGMYFLTGLEANGGGKLLTFEPNEVWARAAESNLEAIGERFRLTIGTFEENIDRRLEPGEQIDLAFIDAIHTKAFVVPQLELVVARSRPGAIIILDDIDFSADMRECWAEVSSDARFTAAIELGNRVGVLELRA